MKLRHFVFAAVALAVLAGAVAVTRAVQRRATVGAFTLKKTNTYYAPAGAFTRRETYRRASNGSFRIITTDGERIYQDRGFAQGRGYFGVDLQSRTLLRNTQQAAHRPPTPVEAETLASSEFFDRTEQLFGLTAYVHRLPGAAPGSVSQETWYIPELGRVPVKAVFYNADGSLAETQEPYELTFGEPEARFVALPDLPVVDMPALPAERGR